MDQGDSVVIAHITFDFNVFVFVKLSNTYILQCVLHSLACLLFLNFFLMNDFTGDAPSVAIFMYVNRLIKGFDVDISFLFVDKGTQFGLDRLGDCGLPLFLPMKQLIFQLLLVHLVLLCLVHPLQVFVKPLLLVFLMHGGLEFTECRMRWLESIEDAFWLDQVWLECALRGLLLLPLLLLLCLFKSCIRTTKAVKRIIIILC